MVMAIHTKTNDGNDVNEDQVDGTGIRETNDGYCSGMGSQQC